MALSLGEGASGVISANDVVTDGVLAAIAQVALFTDAVGHAEVGRVEAGALVQAVHFRRGRAGIGAWSGGIAGTGL